MTETETVHPWEVVGGVPCLSCGPAPGGCGHCRGTGVAYDVQRAAEPRSLIHTVEGGRGEVWQGGFTCLACRACEPRSGTRYFDLVIDLWQPPGVGSPRTTYVTYPIPDGVLTDGQMDGVRMAARHVAKEVEQYDHRVLVRCQWGLNRSGLLVGLALRELGMPGPQAVRVIREKRGPWALSNRLFAEEVERG